MSFSEKAKHSVLQPLHKLLKAKCLMWIQSKHMEQNVFVNWIIHLKKKENSVLLTLMLFQTYMTYFILWDTKGEFLKDILMSLFNK